MSELQTTDRSQLVVHLPKLRALAQHLTQGPDADDFVQDTFVAALDNSAAPRRPGPWLRQVLRNSVRASARNNGRRDELKVLIPETSEASRPDDISEHAEIATKVREVLNELEEPYRTVLRQRFFGEHSTQEIANLADCPHGTIRWRLHEGLRRMKQALDQRFGERARWYGAVVVLGGGEAGAVAPAPETPTMTTTSITTASSLFASGIAPAVAVVGFAAIACATMGQSEPEPSPTAAGPANATAVTSRAQDPAVHSGGTLSAPTRSARRAVAVSASGATSAASPALDAELSAAEARKCGDDALAAFNADADDPDGLEHLVDAAYCFELAGMAAKALRLNMELVARYPDSDYVQESQTAISRTFTAMIDLDAGAATTLGRECLAPVAELGTAAGGPELIAAADCVADGVLVATALHYRELAASHPETIDVKDNDEQITMLSRVLEGLQTKAAAHEEAVAATAEDSVTHE